MRRLFMFPVRWFCGSASLKPAAHGLRSRSSAVLSRSECWSTDFHQNEEYYFRNELWKHVDLEMRWLLECYRPLCRETFVQAWEYVLRAHSPLRAGFVLTGDERVVVKLDTNPESAHEDILSLDVSGLPESAQWSAVQALSHRLRESLTNFTGPPRRNVRFAIIERGQGHAQWVLFVKNHLSMDAVSRKLCLSLLTHAYLCLENKQTLPSIQESKVYEQYCRMIQSYDRTHNLALDSASSPSSSAPHSPSSSSSSAAFDRSSSVFWRRFNQLPPLFFPSTFPSGRALEMGQAAGEMQLSITDPSTLKRLAGRPLPQTLLTVLLNLIFEKREESSSTSSTFGGVIGMVGHGRVVPRSVSSISSISRTELFNSTGWFGSYYPEFFAIDTKASFEDQVRAVTEQWKQTVNGGIDFRIHEAKSRDLVKRFYQGAMNVTFNCIGSLNADIDSRLFSRHPENAGPFFPELRSSASNSMVVMPMFRMPSSSNSDSSSCYLSVTWSYSRSYFSEDYMAELGRAYGHVLCEKLAITVPTIAVRFRETPMRLSKPI